MKRVILTAAAAAITVASAQASLVLTERFTYPDGAIVGAPNSPWNSHSGTGGSMVCSNNMLVVSTSRTEDVNAFLAGVTSLTASSPYNTNSSAVLYSKFQVYFTQTPTAAGAYFAHFKDNLSGASTGFGARIWASATNAVSGGTLSAGKLRLGIANGPNASVTSGQWNTDLTTNVIYTVVTRFVPATGLSTLWINPTAESDTSVTATDGDKLPDRPIAMDVYAYAFRQNSGEGTMFIDNLKVATTFDDLSAPAVSFIANQATPANTPTAAIPFTVADDETPAASLTVTASSGNTALVPNANIVLGGSGGNRTVTITPTSNVQGSATITLVCTDTDNKSTTSSFVLTVGAPSISAIPSIDTPANTTPSPVSFTVGDTESPASSLTLSAISSNPALLPNANVIFGGSGANRTVTVTPATGQTGSAAITVGVSDGVNTTTTVFNVTVYPVIGLLFSDDFNYPDGGLYLAPGSPWDHHSPTGTNFFEVAVSNSAVVLSQGLQEDVNAGITNAIGAAFDPTTGYVLYSGFTVKFTALPSAAGDYFAHFRDNGTSFRARIFASTTNAAAGKFRIGIANQGGASSIDCPVDLSLNTTYSVVAKYNVASGLSTLWVNPQTESGSHFTASDAPGITSIATYAFRQSSGIGTNIIDNLKIGTSFADVATILAPLTPDPIPLNIAVSGSSVTLSWTNSAFKLQSGTSVAGPYSDVLGAASPYTTSTTGTQKYFRLKF